MVLHIQEFVGEVVQCQTSGPIPQKAHLIMKLPHDKFDMEKDVTDDVARGVQ